VDKGMLKFFNNSCFY